MADWLGLVEAAYVLDGDASRSALRRAPRRGAPDRSGRRPHGMDVHPVGDALSMDGLDIAGPDPSFEQLARQALAATGEQLLREVVESPVARVGTLGAARRCARACCRR